MTMQFLYVCGIVILFILVGYVSYLEYIQTKKHFPGMTYSEYVLIEDKIRITPH